MLGFPGRRKQQSGIVGVAFGPSGLAVASVGSGGRDALPRLHGCDQLLGDDPAALAAQLAEWVEAHDLGNATTNAILAPGDYQLLQVEAPSVPDTEMRQAAGWRVRELIDFPIDQAVVDTFRPPESTQRNQPNINVVVAHRAAIAERIEQIREAGLALNAIDIPELAQGNVSERLPDARGGHALLALDEADGLLTVYRDREQYLARTLDSGRAELVREADGAGRAAESLLLEVQRSFDYFESSLSQPPLGALYIYPPDDAVDRLARSMEENLANVDCRAFALADLLAVDEEPERGDATLLRAVGGALRDLGAQ